MEGHEEDDDDGGEGQEDRGTDACDGECCGTDAGVVFALIACEGGEVVDVLRGRDWCVLGDWLRSDLGLRALW